MTRERDAPRIVGATVLVDGNNVIGAAVDGWWRDRPRAARVLLRRLQCYAVAAGDRVELVLDVVQPDLTQGDHQGVAVHYATRRGRDAADDRIVELVGERDAPSVEVITSDRALADRVCRLGAGVSGAGAFLRRLEGHGC